MNKYIDADEVIKVLTNNQTYSATVLQAVIDRIPKADIEPVQHGHWEKECRSEITLSNGETTTLIERMCSNCHLWSDKEILKYYPTPAKRCSVCGAYMDEKVDKK